MDRDKVWTFGGGPRQCIGKLLSAAILRVCFCVNKIGGMIFFLGGGGGG